MTPNSVIVVGGGISGLSAARTLADKGIDYALIERAPAPGGLTRTIQVADYCFDYTGHLLHLARSRSPAEVPLAGLCDDDWAQIHRRSYAYIEGALVTAPVQYHLRELPEPLRSDVVASYDNRPRSAAGTPSTSFRDYVVSGFGERLAEVFLIPQNEKTQATRLDRLSMEAVKRFFPPPVEEKIRAGLREAASSDTTYNSQFWYPREGGIGRLVDGLSRGLERVYCREEIVSFDLDSRVATARGGRSWRWDRLLSSIPLKDLCRRTNDASLRSAAESLTHSSTIVFNVGIRGELPPALLDAQWIYVPDRSIPFYRVGFYSQISPGMCPPGHHAVYIEVGVQPSDYRSESLTAALQERVFQALERLGWVRRDQVECCVAHVIPCAYVHHTREREEVFAEIAGRLEASGISLIGRYGLWDYTSMEDSIYSGIEFAERCIA